MITEIENIRKSVSQLNVTADNEKENLKRKYQPKIREKKNAIRENEYFLEQNKSKSNEATIRLNELTHNAESEKKKAIEIIDKEIEKITEIELKAKEEVSRVEEELNKLIKAKEKDRDTKIQAEEENVNKHLINLEAELKIEDGTIKKRKEDINTQKNKELSKKGADTKRLAEIDKRIEEIRVELVFIDENRATVSDYEKDKRELFDKVDEFKQQKQLLDKKLEQEEKKFCNQKEAINRDLAAIKEIIQSLTESVRHISDDNEAFDAFNGSECYNTIRERFLNSQGEHKTEKRVKYLIDEIKEIHYDRLNKRMDEIRRSITDFLGKFSEDNIFKFKKQLTDIMSFLDFAEMLSDFVEENKIERIENEVNERFALIISTIGKETTALVSEAGKIQNVVKKINDDFIEKNFAGVIKKIELKIDNSKNEVVQLLLQIKKYNDENIFDLGKPNLFSSESQEKKNKDAVDLLKQFVKKIGELKRDYISLSDSFELKFRIEENQNDTGWVEKLSNVGSDGTDVLVKAMLNIMLLNVFKEGASKRFKDFQLHCMMDEIGKLHPNNVRGILKFANERNILLINSSPIENDALAFKHIYKLKKDEKGITRVNRILTQYAIE